MMLPDMSALPPGMFKPLPGYSGDCYACGKQMTPEEPTMEITPPGAPRGIKVCLNCVTEVGMNPASAEAKVRRALGRLEEELRAEGYTMQNLSQWTP